MRASSTIHHGCWMMMVVWMEMMADDYDVE
jgi:hypothetical protein